ncbi:V-type proton ATPase subunit c 1 [Olea europaea subsp. europaea]|uniref:V-type proton ATPase subunit c 1 n=1 Tax=Olea europaea subsp. europaea TaxID=158383 RepID=A0A8S0S2W4_OLEEU|nr:V-type proton ATPase subunit c 1 [Olea europaea subsp. europaea]
MVTPAISWSWALVQISSYTFAAIEITVVIGVSVLSTTWGIYITESSLIGAAIKAPRVTSKNLIKTRKSDRLGYFHEDAEVLELMIWSWEVLGPLVLIRGVEETGPCYSTDRVAQRDVGEEKVYISEKGECFESIRFSRPEIYNEFGVILRIEPSWIE